MNLISFSHPSSGERVKVSAEDLASDRSLIGLYNEDGTKRSRAEAWLGDGKPSDIGLEEARAAIRIQYADSTHLIELKVLEARAGHPR